MKHTAHPFWVGGSRQSLRPASECSLAAPPLMAESCTIGGTKLSRCDISPCCCYMKMSWGNCYVKVSWGAPFVEESFPHGDLHDEPEGVAPGRPGQGRPRRTHHQSARSQESAAERPAISALEAPPRGGRGRSPAPPEPWPAVLPPFARTTPPQGDDPHDHHLCRLQRCPSHRETARGLAPVAQPRGGAPPECVLPARAATGRSRSSSPASGTPRIWAACSRT